MASEVTGTYLPALVSQEVSLRQVRNYVDLESSLRRDADTDTDDDAAVQVNLSADAQQMLARGDDSDSSVEASSQTPDQESDAQGFSGTGGKTETSSAGGLTDSEKDLVKRLQARDAEVRQHEQQHMAAAGELAIGGPRYTYQIGPDGKSYAVGGSVMLDTSIDFSDPNAKEKAAKIRRAANASGDNSAADSAVSSRAAALEQQAVASGDSKWSVLQAYRPELNRSAGSLINRTA